MYINNNKPRDVKDYYAQEPLITDKLEKLPNWLRWIIAIPAGIIGYVIFWAIISFSWYFFFQTKANDSYVGLSIQSMVFIVIPLAIIYDCVPKYKFRITVVLATLAIINSIMNTGIALVLRPAYLNLDFFIVDILQNILTSIVAVMIIITVFNQKYKIDKKIK